MIITRLMGGLGNQMFQYAAGRALALRLGMPLRVDPRDLGGEGQRAYQLSAAFGLTTAAVTAKELSDVVGWRSRHASLMRLALSSAGKALRGKSVRVEPHFHYWLDFSSIVEPSYISGYWQSERYFSDQQEIIRSEFRFSSMLNGAEADLAQKIRSCEAVSIHVRRGDYVSDPRAHVVHGVCPLDYYARAVKRIRERVRAPQFFLFSDDIEWVRRNLSIEGAIYASSEGAGRASWIDMQLMSLCQHQIIANSTYSWWAAWLNPSDRKQVIAPKRWFSANAKTHDLYPAQWTLL